MITLAFDCALFNPDVIISFENLDTGRYGFQM